MQNVQYHPSIAINAADMTRLVPIHCDRDIEDRVKEREVLTGKPGRKFVVVGAERLTYHVEWSVAGLNVRRLKEDGEFAAAQFVPSRQVKDHTLGNALHCGQLFTLGVH